MRWTKHWLLRASVVLCVAATMLVPSISAPARVLQFPETVARTLSWSKPGAHARRVNFDFPATHIGFSWRGEEGSGVLFRTIDERGRRSQWQRAPEAHDAERGDLHFSGVLTLDRATALEWRPRGPRGAPITDVKLDYLNTLDGEVREVEVPATAEAAARTPDIITRAEWGADESVKRVTGGCRRQFFRVQQLFVHHTAGSNFDRNPAATMRAIYWYHTVRQGWCDVGYNFVVSHDGRIFEGRWARRYKPWEVHDSEDRFNRAVMGAHVSGFNSGSVGISLMGNYSTISLPPSGRRALAELLAWEADRHNLPPRASHTYRNPTTGVRRYLPFIAGHRDAGSTACPGNYVYSSLRAIRRDTAAVIGAGKAESRVTLTPLEPKIDYGETAAFTGSLTGPDGVGLAAQNVTSYAKKAGGTWYQGPSAMTGPDGTFSFTLTPPRNIAVIAVYEGDASMWGTESAAARVRVRPLVSLQAEGGNDISGVAHYPPGTATVPLSGTVAPAHPGAKVKVWISRPGPDGIDENVAVVEAVLNGSSTYRIEFPVPADGTNPTYKAVTWFGGDLDHAPAPSNEVLFVVDPSP